jgi:hypothetical protein
MIKSIYCMGMGLLVLLTSFLVSTQAMCQGSSPDFASPAQIASRLRALQQQHSSITKIESLAKSPGGNDIWALTIGSGDRDNHPAIAIVGGIYGPHLIGTELALQFAEKLLAGANTDSIKNLLASHTFYVFPSVNPDAMAQYFAPLKYERLGNATATDDDRDGRMGEDPFEDLNKDGLITMLRVEDPTGEWKTHPADPRVMVKANKEKGEIGMYRLYTEGFDNDLDGHFNEDGEGGVHLHKSFTWQYPAFTTGSGEFPVSEKETRALLDFFYDRWNVYAVFSFTPSDNLTAPMRYEAPKAAQRVTASILENDAKVNEMVSGRYVEISGKKDGKVAVNPGGFMEWAYFHYGRFSFSTPGWYVPPFEMPKDSVEKAKYLPNTDKNADVDFLRWAEKNASGNVFVPWQQVSHPSFNGKKAEVGGFRPFVKLNPPFNMVDSLARLNNQFIVKLAGMAPQVQIVNAKTESVGRDVYRVTLDVYNKGLLPTSSDMGQRTTWIRRIKVELGLAKGQEILSGKKITLITALDADGHQQLTWLVRGKGNLAISAGAPHTGIQKINLDLK